MIKDPAKRAQAQEFLDSSDQILLAATVDVKDEVHFSHFSLTFLLSPLLIFSHFSLIFLSPVSHITLSILSHFSLISLTFLSRNR